MLGTVATAWGCHVSQHPASVTPAVSFCTELRPRGRFREVGCAWGRYHRSSNHVLNSTALNQGKARQGGRRNSPKHSLGGHRGPCDIQAPSFQTQAVFCSPQALAMPGC